jgi:hypothetical protein
MTTQNILMRLWVHPGGTLSDVWLKSIYEGWQASKKIFFRASSLEKFVRTEGICTNLASKASNLLDILRGIDNYHAILNESASLNQACKTKDGKPV